MSLSHEISNVTTCDKITTQGIQVFMDLYNQWASSTLKVRSKLNHTSTAPCTEER
jgi:hypothetical protein